jgi:hypothetical protein
MKNIDYKTTDISGSFFKFIFESIKAIPSGNIVASYKIFCYNKFIAFRLW